MQPVVLDLNENNIDLINNERVFASCKYVSLSFPTTQGNALDPDSKVIEAAIQLICKINPSAGIIINSLVPVGFCEEMTEKHKLPGILFTSLLPEKKILIASTYESKTHQNEYAKLIHKSHPEMEVVVLNPRDAELLALRSNEHHVKMDELILDMSKLTDK